MSENTEGRLKWIRVDEVTLQVEPTTQETATHVVITTHDAARRTIEKLQRELRHTREAIEALDARVEELTNLNSRLYDKHQKTLNSKRHWRARALKTEGDESARRMLLRKEEIVSRDGSFWSVRSMEVEAGSEVEAVDAAREALKRTSQMPTRINRIRGLGAGEWVAEVLVLLDRHRSPGETS